MNAAPSWKIGVRNILSDFDMKALRKIPRVSYYFLYLLHTKDFRDLEICGKLRGHYTAKPLYGRMTKDGYVDKTAGFNGDIAALFIPIEAKALEEAELLITHMEVNHITLPAGRKNWPLIHSVAEKAIKEALKKHDEAL